MKRIKIDLLKRKKIALIVIWTIALCSLLFEHFYGFEPVSYVAETYRYYAVAFLLFYKIVELFLFHFFLYKKNYLKLLEENFHVERLKKFEKRSKQFFFLVPQGSVVFGIIAYKVTAVVWFVPLFVLIATVALLLVNPKELKEA
jgi:hypothetical protein